MNEDSVHGRSATDRIPLRLLVSMQASDGWFWPVSGDATTKGLLYDEPQLEVGAA